MSRLSCWLVCLVLSAFLFPGMARAEHEKPDDRVIFDVTAEDWVTTKTARVTANVNASVSGATAGTARASMEKALDDLVKTDWRLIAFNRGQDQTGMEFWNVTYEARLPENQLSGLNEKAKKLSKPGLQVAISNIDFSPTLDETQTAMGQVRSKIYKMANDQLAALNAAMPGRTYRIALVDFVPEDDNVAPRPAMARLRADKAMFMEANAGGTAPAPAAAPMERSEKIVMTARVVLAATPPATSTK